MDSLDDDSDTQEVPEIKKKDGKVDNRKLVYEDIWDDKPSPWQRTVPNPELPTTPQLGEEFVPWAAPKLPEPERPEDFTEEEITRRANARKKQLQGGAAPGMTMFDMDRRAKELADEEQEAMKEIAGDDGFKPSWYSRQQEKVNEITRKLAATEDEPSVSKKSEEPKKHVFAPPARGKAASAPPQPEPDNELDEMD